MYVDESGCDDQPRRVDAAVRCRVRQIAKCCDLPVKDTDIRLDRGRTLLVDVEASIGIRQDSLLSELDLLGREKVLLTSSFQDLTGKDQYEAATQLKELEANLEASYLLTSRLSNLSLLNYLR